jgi:DNA-binding GntR family transcriptional regulator
MAELFTPVSTGRISTDIVEQVKRAIHDGRQEHRAFVSAVRHRDAEAAAAIVAADLGRTAERVGPHRRADDDR